MYYGCKGNTFSLHRQENGVKSDGAPHRKTAANRLAIDCKHALSDVSDCRNEDIFLHIFFYRPHQIIVHQACTQ